MARSRLINPYPLVVAVLVCAICSGARAETELLKVDINTSLNITYTGWTGWQLPSNRAEIANTFSNGIRVAFSHPTNNTVVVGARGNTNWGAFAGDLITTPDSGVGLGDMACVISFLSPGQYTFTTYHNEEQANSDMDVYAQVGSGPKTQVYTDIPQCPHVPNNEYVIANGAVPLTFTISQPGENFRAEYISSWPNVANPNDVNSYRVAICGFKLVANAIYAAYGPFPLPQSTIRYNTSYNLEWTTPDPYEAGTQRYDLYFTTDPNDLTDTGTGAPLFPADKRLVTYQVQSGRMSYPCPALTAYKTYYWRVDSYGMQGGSEVKTVGMVWQFNTNNQPPALTIAQPYQVTVQGRSVTLSAAATDLDGLPIGSSISYNWTARNDPNDPNYALILSLPLPSSNPSVSFVLDPNDTIVGGGRTYTFRCTVSDTANSSYQDVYVVVYDDAMTYCEVNKKHPDYQSKIRSAGDFNDDCMTDMRDLSTYAVQWLECKAINGICW